MYAAQPSRQNMLLKYCHRRASFLDGGMKELKGLSKRDNPKIHG
jgi:hypothetical protein